MKLLLATLLIPTLSQAADSLVACKLTNFAKCDKCETRIPVSCDDNTAQGSLELSHKPAKIQWLVSNKTNGTEKIVTTENKTVSVKDLKSAKDLKALALKQKVSAGQGEVVTLAVIQVAAGTALYKEQTGKEIAMTLKAQNPQRAIASDAGEAKIGGVGRAQNLKAKK